MKKKDEMIFVTGIIVLIIIVLIYVPIENTYLGLFLEQFTEVEWDEVLDRNIVKNAIPITLLVNKGDRCVVSAPTFDLIIDHPYFKRSAELASMLNYDRQTQTLTIPCDMMPHEKSKLHVWYVLEESPKHSKKYQYFITPWNETIAK
ncbi:MAG: hypothetical protein AB1608_02690 [Thermoproteota archaeon]